MALASGRAADGAAVAQREQFRILPLLDTESIRTGAGRFRYRAEPGYLGSGLHGEEDVGQQRVGSEGEVEGDEPGQQRPEHQENVEEPGDGTRTGSGQKAEPSQNRARLLVPGSFSNC